MPTKIFIFLFSFLECQLAMAQFAIRQPLVNAGNVVITDTVYMSPTGDDAADGTDKHPVRSFQKALDLLPFGKTGVNNGNAYGLIRLLPGRYLTYDGFAQRDGSWKKNDTYKNVSVEGIGEVIIGGSADSIGNGHLLTLLGNNIFIKNVQLRNSMGMGLLLRGEPGRMMHDLWVDGVKTDSLGSFGILIVNADAVEIQNCEVLRSGQTGNRGLVSPCQWPSGLKVLGCSQVRVHHSEVGFTRGEGLNFQNSLNGEAYRNRLHDNTVNFYNDNSKNLVIRQNHFFNTPQGEKDFWQGCPSDTATKNTPGGILMANEGSCTNGSNPVFENCQTKCLFPQEYVKNVDSIFIFNNLFQRVGVVLNIWEGSTQIIGVNCISNVFFYNNTAIGCMGNTNSNLALVNFFFPYYNPLLTTYSKVENFQIYNNIFAVDKQTFARIRGFIPNFNALHPTKNAVKLGGNLWSFNADNKGNSDSVQPALPGDVDLVVNGDFQAFVPCDNNIAFIKTNTSFGHVPTVDFLDSVRVSASNVGAFEYQKSCKTANIERVYNRLVVYPNPTRQIFSISGHRDPVKMYDHSGRFLFVLNADEFGKYTLPASTSMGIYTLVIETSDTKLFTRLVVDLE